jgi:hypothetical protein
MPSIVECKQLKEIRSEKRASHRMDVNIAGAIANMLLDLEHAVKQINSDSL